MSDTAAEWRDAAEFEARVALELSNMARTVGRLAPAFGPKGFCPSNETLLYFARLQVEADMEALGG